MSRYIPYFKLFLCSLKNIDEKIRLKDSYLRKWKKLATWKTIWYTRLFFFFFGLLVLCMFICNKIFCLRNWWVFFSLRQRYPWTLPRRCDPTTEPPIHCNMHNKKTKTKHENSFRSQFGFVSLIFFFLYRFFFSQNCFHFLFFPIKRNETIYYIYKGYIFLRHLKYSFGVRHILVR